MERTVVRTAMTFFDRTKLSILRIFRSPAKSIVSERDPPLKRGGTVFCAEIAELNKSLPQYSCLPLCKSATVCCLEVRHVDYLRLSGQSAAVTDIISLPRTERSSINQYLGACGGVLAGLLGSTVSLRADEAEARCPVRCERVDHRRLFGHSL